MTCLLLAACTTPDPVVSPPSTSDTVVSQPTTTTSATSSTTWSPPEIELTESLPCGTGFTVANSDGTYLLLVRPNYVPSSNKAIVVDFPDPDWTAVLHTGEHLTVNWCNDIRDSNQPQRVIRDEWRVISGTLSFTTPSGKVSGCRGNRTIRAELTGIEIARSAADIVDLPDMTVTNEQYGCDAG